MLRAAFLCALVAVAASRASAQEAQYTVTLPDKQKLFLSVSLFPGAGETRATARLFSRQTGGLAAPLQADVTMTTASDGKPDRCRVFWGPTGGVGVILEALRADTRGTSEAYNIQVPRLAETLPFSGKLLSHLSVGMFVGRQYDWRRGGEQTFSYLLDYATPLPKLYTVKLAADGEEEITLERGKVKARKLKYQAPLPFLPKEQQAGVLYVGPNGELLRSDTALLGGPYLAKGAAAWDPGARTLETEWVAPASLSSRATLFPARNQVEIGLKDSVQLAKMETDAAFAILRQESPWLGRPLRVTVGQGVVRYELEPTPATFAKAESGRAFFLPHWFVTELWEKGDGPWAGMAVGDKREGDYFPLFNGHPGSYPFTLERRADVPTVFQGRPLNLRRYSFQSGNNYEVYSDGARLVAAIGSDGTLFQRDGWEAVVAPLPRPETPKPPAPPVAK